MKRGSGEVWSTVTIFEILIGVAVGFLIFFYMSSLMDGSNADVIAYKIDISKEMLSSIPGNGEVLILKDTQLNYEDNKLSKEDEKQDLILYERGEHFE